MMNKAIVSVIVLAVMTVMSCGKEAAPEDIAGTVARQYYQYLLDGKYAEFVDGHYQPDSIPSAYREQLIANAKMFAAQQKADHGGMVKVEVVKSSADTARHVADVFLSVAYGDSTMEEIVVPMVYVDGNWMMR